MDAPAIRVEPGRLDFGEVVLGDVATLPLTVANDGGAPLRLAAVSIDGEGSAAFTVPTDPAGTLVEGAASVTFDVAFAADGGPAEAELLLQSDDPASPTVAVPLAGASLVGDLEIDPTPVDFGETTAGRAVETTVSLRNVGTAPVSVEAINVVGDAFRADALTLPAALAPGEEVGLGLTFAPDTAGTFTGALWVAADDPRGTHEANLVGTASPSNDLGEPGSIGDCGSAGPGWDWADWTSVSVGEDGGAAGTIAGPDGAVGVEYDGEIAFGQTATGTTFWVPARAYLSDVVANAPATPDILAFVGDRPTVHRLRFSHPVECVAMAVASLGTREIPVELRFSSPLRLLSSGRGYFGPGELQHLGGGRLRGREGYGTVLFQGPIRELVWTSGASETWQAFTVGVPHGS